MSDLIVLLCVFVLGVITGREHRTHQLFNKYFTLRGQQKRYARGSDA